MVVPVEVIREIAHRHALPQSPLIPLRGLGSVNHVFVLGTDPQRYVVRLPIDELRHDEFGVEQWCLKEAPKHGIPSPRVIARGDVSGTPYLVLVYVDGARCDEQCDLEVWETLGRYGQLAHTIDYTAGPDQLFTRFGRDPDDAWRRHLHYNLEQLTETDHLIALGVYPSTKQQRIRAMVNELLTHNFVHGLRHGDLAPRNLLMSVDDGPVLLDWGQATVGPIPHGDLLAAMRSHLVEGQPTAEELDVFSLALGTPLREIRDVLEHLLVVDALDRVRWALDNRPDRLGDLVRDARDTLRVQPGL